MQLVIDKLYPPGRTIDACNLMVNTKDFVWNFTQMTVFCSKSPYLLSHCIEQPETTWRTKNSSCGRFWPKCHCKSPMWWTIQNKSGSNETVPYIRTLLCALSIRCTIVSYFFSRLDKMGLFTYTSINLMC